MDKLICKVCQSEHFDATLVAHQPVALTNGVLKIDYCNESQLTDIYCAECGKVYNIKDFNINQIK